MKVLLVAEQLDIQDFLRQLCPDPAIQFFQYTNPLKAMDNLEEIHPTIVLWNTDDFPRHWKTFLPFCKSLFPHDMPRIHLISETPLSDEEVGKAEALSVDGLHGQGFFNESLAELLIINQSAYTPDSSIDRIPTIPGGSGILQIQHPGLRRILIADLLSADQKSLKVRFLDPGLAKQFTKNMIIEHAFFRIEELQAKVILRLATIDDDGTYQFLILQFL